MVVSLKPMSEQVIVITGASSGIGLVTAKQAAARGACVILVARNGHDLQRAVQEIRDAGGRAIAVTADVADPMTADTIAAQAIAAFGRIDTWVNNAAVSLYGKAVDLSIDDMRQQFDVNYWGQVYGSRAAVKCLRERGGALINVASALADRAIPLQGNYCAGKHALKAFTDALRMELEADGVPISVTLVKPASIDTPFFDKAKSLLDHEPQPVPPVYAPEVAAKAILTAAEKPTRDIVAGGAGRATVLASHLPRLADKYMERRLFRKQQSKIPRRSRPDNLYHPVADDGGERGKNWTGRTKGTSAYTSAVLHPRAAAAIAGVAVSLVAAAILWRGRQLS